jgi:hypothetical protein
MAIFLDSQISGSATSTGSFGRVVIDTNISESSPLTVDGTSGRLFTVTDQMSGSVFSANLISGLPVIEAFSDNKVNIGPFSSPIQIDSSGNISGSSTSTGSFGHGFIDGKLGINTTSPVDRFHIVGAIRAQDGSSAVDYVRVFHDGTDGQLTSNRGKLKLEAQSSAYMVELVSAGISGSSTSTGSFGRVEVPAQSGGGPITLGGGAYQDVIIGDGSGTADIVLDGNSEAVLRYKIGGSEKWFLMARSSNNFVFRRNSADRVTIDTNGNFAIGFNLVPTERLHVGGNIFATGNISGSATSTGSFASLHTPDSGKVGFGTTAPLAQVHIKNNPVTNYGQLIVEGHNQDREYISFKDTVHGVHTLIGGFFSTQYHTHIDNVDGGNIHFRTANSNADSGQSNRMVILAGGNVGIGTTSPGQKLEIDSGNIQLSDGQQLQWGDGNNAIFGHASQDYVQIKTDGTDRVKITSAGLEVFTGNVSGSSTSTGSFGHLLVNGSAVGGSSPDATDGSQSLISGSTDSTGSFGRIVLDGHQNPKINFKDNDISLGEDALLGTGNSHNVAIGYRAAAGSISGYQVAIGYLALSGSGGSNNHNVAIGTETLSVNIDGNNYHNTAVGGYALQSGSYRSATAFGYAAAQNYTGTTPIVAVGASAAKAVSGLNITAIGASAMNSTGSANNSVAVGSNALQKINSSNGGLTAVGYFALRNNTTGYYNTAIGPFALEDNTTAYSNVAITGYGALKENTTGTGNTAIGTNTMERNLTGVQNIAIGGNAIRYHTDSDYNIAIGVNAMQNVSVGTPTYNIAVGYWAGYNSKGDNNVMIGQAAGYSSGPTTVDFNVFIGYYAGRLFVSGSDNVAVGKNAMYQGGKLGTNATDNVAVGENALYNVGGLRNVGIGLSAMSQMRVGNDNVAVGYRAGQLLASGNRTSGSNSVYIGHTTISGTNNSSNEIVIGANAIGKGTNTVVLGDDTITDIYLSEDKGAIVYGGTFSGSAFIDDGTQLNVPDYVFEPEYDLKSLEYVETHISQSKHLPGVPSRDDKEGWVSYDMGGRDMLLLEKIEELTLYIIDLEKRIKILEENK